MNKRRNDFSAILIFVSAALLFSTTGFATSAARIPPNNLKNSPNPKKELEQLKKQINYLRRTLTTTRHKRNQLVKTLKSSELSINYIATQLQHIKKQIAQENKKIYTLNRKQRHYQKKWKNEQQLLALQLRQAYQLEHNQHTQILLSIDSLDNMSRLLIYHRYLEQAREHQLNQLQYSLRKIAHNREELFTHKKKLQQLKKRLQHNQQNVHHAHRVRQLIINAMAADIKTQREKLATLSANKHKLEQLIKALAAHPVSSEQTARFFRMRRGKLPWPTHGKIIHHFGTRIENSEIRWNAVVIRAPSTHAVYAIAPGRVVFAGWMPQYGLLIIIDHGKGYLSLYGHNQLLYYKVGDAVQARELIARVGNTGGQKMAALYFGIWHNNTKLNPELWCLGQP